jgi:hypothetical protein
LITKVRLSQESRSLWLRTGENERTSRQHAVASDGHLQGKGLVIASLPAITRFLQRYAKTGDYASIVAISASGALAQHALQD